MIIWENKMKMGKYGAKKCFLIGIVVTMLSPLSALAASQEEIATDLTTLLRSARAITVNKTTIADPSIFNIKKFLRKTEKNYKRANDKKVSKSGKMVKSLFKAVEIVVTNAKNGQYTGKWPSGQYANKFLPARFAREVGIEFGKLTEGKGLLKLTTSNALLVNEDNEADEWESNVIESKFNSGNWPKNQVFSEQTSEGFRLILPEYYKTGCMGCHSGENGKSIHAGGVEGQLNKFGGAISIILK
jgi:hypothetical protein